MNFHAPTQDLNNNIIKIFSLVIHVGMKQMLVGWLALENASEFFFLQRSLYFHNQYKPLEKA